VEDLDLVLVVLAFPPLVQAQAQAQVLAPIPRVSRS